jgi:hypothetical protein
MPMNTAPKRSGGFQSRAPPPRRSPPGSSVPNRRGATVPAAARSPVSAEPKWLIRSRKVAGPTLSERISRSHSVAGDRKGRRRAVPSLAGRHQPLSPIRLSVPETRRRMFSWCLRMVISDITTNSDATSPACRKDISASGTATAAAKCCKRRKLEHLGHAEPDRGKHQNDQRSEAEQHTEIGRNSLAALELEPDRIEMPRNAPSPAISAASMPSNCRATRTPTVPLSASASSVAAASFLLPVRAHWLRRYCPIRSCGHHPARPCGSGSDRTGSSRKDSRTAANRASWERTASIGSYQARRVLPPFKPVAELSGRTQAR